MSAAPTRRMSDSREGEPLHDARPALDLAVGTLLDVVGADLGAVRGPERQASATPPPRTSRARFRPPSRSFSTSSVALWQHARIEDGALCAKIFAGLARLSPGRPSCGCDATCAWCVTQRCQAAPWNSLGYRLPRGLRGRPRRQGARRRRRALRPRGTPSTRRGSRVHAVHTPTKRLYRVVEAIAVTTAWDAERPPRGIT